MNTFETYQEVITEPGMDKYFRTQKGKNFLDSVSEDTMCYISLDSQDSDDYIAAKKVMKIFCFQNFVFLEAIFYQGR